jgi:hypothetical protein
MERGAIVGDQRCDHVNAPVTAQRAQAKEEFVAGVVAAADFDPPPLIRGIERLTGGEEPTQRYRSSVGVRFDHGVTLGADLVAFELPHPEADADHDQEETGHGTDQPPPAREEPVHESTVDHSLENMLIDRYGRTATDLRVSLTDRCNLRCTYCMPEEGLSWLPKPEMLTDDEVVRLGMLPQVLPVMLSQALYYFESNTRSATILGVVGAGGIGLQLADRIRVNNWDEVGFILIMILLTVTLIDLLSTAIRLRIIHSGQSAP